MGFGCKRINLAMMTLQEEYMYMIHLTIIFIRYENRQIKQGIVFADSDSDININVMQ